MKDIANNTNKVNNIINKLFEGVSTSINELLTDISKNIDKLVNSNNNKNNVDEFSADTRNFSGVLYDVYYEFCLMKLESKFNDFTIGIFNYPCYFDININNTDYALRVTSIHKDYKMIYTSLLFDNKQLSKSDFHYDCEYKNHVNMDSIVHTLFDVKEKILKNQIAVY